MAHMDVRQFMDALQETGDIVKVEREVDWDLELGAIGRRACERQEPAILFERIKDYPEHRIFSGMLGTFRRVAIWLGLPPTTPVKDIYAEYDRRIANPIKPEIVDGAPCKENVVTGDDVDLYELPAPYLHEGDGGRYIGTWAFEVTKDPDTGWQNWGMYRFMVHNRRYIVGWPRYSGHLGMVLHQKHVPNNKPMPMALVIGACPSCMAASTVSFGVGADEADYAGALDGVLVIGLARRQLGWQEFLQANMAGLRTSCMVLFLITGATVFGHFMAITRLPFILVNTIEESGLSPTAIMGFIILFYFIGGCFIDAMALVVLTVPFIYPLVTGLGFDPIWFGVIIVLVSGVAVITPPVGVNAYVIKGISPETPLKTIFKGILPFLVPMMATIAILIAFPEIATFLPNLITW